MKIYHRPLVLWHRWLLTFGFALLTLVIGLIPQVNAQSISLPAGFAETLVASGLTQPTTMTFAPDGRLFVTQQTGALRVIQNDVLLSTPFLTLTVDSNGERGLLGIAFDPNFTTNHYLYLYYTVPGSPPHNRVSRFTANGNVVVPGSEVVLLNLDNLSGATNHNGGSLHFGTDGKLYIAVGENANGSNAQSNNNLLGKMLRINANGTIPADNPVFNPPTTGQNRAIWAKGLRNPFTFEFQPGTGRMFINDVGQNTYEEINDGIAGSNYGWPGSEGPDNITAGIRAPLYYYTHSGACAITGGVFYNPETNQFPADYIGDYFFADYCGNWIRRYDVASDSAQNFATNTPSSPVDLDLDSYGSLYFLARQSGSNGAVYRISYTAGLTTPSITSNPASQIVPVGEAVSFSCAASGSPPLHYQWQRNNVNIPNATGTSYSIPSPTPNDNGNYRCRVSNLVGPADSSAATLTVVNGHRPSAQITAPLVNKQYVAGETIVYSGTATDQEDGVLPPSAYTWEVVFHHETHTHPFVAPHSGVTSDSFVTPIQSHRSIDIWYRIHLTVTDSTNLTSSVYVDVHPKTVRITLRSVGSGLQINVDGQPGTTPYYLDEVVGVNWDLSALTPQIIGSTEWKFELWSDGGNADHTLVVPAVNSTYTATYLSCPILDSSDPGSAPNRNYFTVSTPTLTWARVSYALGYEVRVDNTPDFSGLEYQNDQISADTLSVTIDPPLQDCTYYWHVRAKIADGKWGNWSTTEAFTIKTH